MAARIDYLEVNVNRITIFVLMVNFQRQLANAKVLVKGLDEYHDRLV